MSNIKSAEEKIINLIFDLEKKGKIIPKKLNEISDVPFRSYESLIDQFNQGNIIVKRFAFEYLSGIFNLLSTPFERSMQMVYTFGAFGLPLISIALAIFHSWWWLLGGMSPIFFLSWNKKLYNVVILRSAISSEVVFCFLFYIRQISITSSDYSRTYYWEEKGERS